MNIVLTGTKSGLRQLKEPGCWSFIIHTQEMGFDDIEKLTEIDDFCKILITDKGINKEQIEAIEEVEIDQKAKAKSKSEQLRLTLMEMWHEQSEGYATFKEYYQFKMDLIINHYKSALVKAQLG